MKETAEQLSMDFNIPTVETSPIDNPEEISSHDSYLIEHYINNRSNRENTLYDDFRLTDVHTIAKGVINQVETYNEYNSILGVIDSSPRADAAFEHLRECDQGSCQIALTELLGTITSEVRKNIRQKNLTRR